MNESNANPREKDDPPPRRPAPDPGDCCGGGCVRCVYDLHDEAMARYEAALAAWRGRHPGIDPGDG